MGLIIALVPMAGAQDGGQSTVSVPVQPLRTLAADARGVRARSVREVVAEQRAARRLASLDPDLIRLANDPTAYLDTTGIVFFADTAPPEAAQADPAMEGVSTITGSAFELHSRPGSSRTIYLDFDGETVTNSAWNSLAGQNPKTVTPYDLDGLPNTFGSYEQSYVESIWQVVAEDFAPFDVDITTQRPASNDAFIRNYPDDPTYGAIAVITPDRWLCSFCGGIAYLDIHSPYRPADMTYQYAWVFATPAWSSDDVGNVISHELGHNLSLTHDGVTNQSEYYSGTSRWAPIMGSPARPTFAQWSRGEYPNANNSEDDLAKLGGYLGEAPDTSTSPADAIRIGPDAFASSPEELISSRTDVDYFTFDVTDGQAIVYLNTTVLNSNLLPTATLSNSSGAIISTTTVAWTNLQVLHTGSLDNGRYTIAVRGTAAPGNEFSEYASLGHYRLMVVRPQPPTTPAVTLQNVGDQTFSASWSEATSVGSPVDHYDVQLCDEVDRCTSVQSVFGTSTALAAPERSGRFSAKVVATNRFQQQSQPGRSGFMQVLSKPKAAAISKVRHDPTNRQLTIEWSGSVGYAPVTITHQLLRILNLIDGATMVVDVGTASSGTTSFTLAQNWEGAQVQVIMSASSGYSDPWSSGDSSLASIWLARVGAPSAPVSTLPRTGAPNAGGSEAGRTGAPSA